MTDLSSFYSIYGNYVPNQEDEIDVEENRRIREVKFSKKVEQLKGGRNRSWKKLSPGDRPIRINDRMFKFINEINIGRLYGNIDYDEDEIGNDIQDYLYFMDKNNPLYRITTVHIITLIIDMYRIINDIEVYRCKFRGGEVNGILPPNYPGRNDDSSIREYFPYTFKHFHRLLGISQDKVKFCWNMTYTLITDHSSPVEYSFIDKKGLLEDFLDKTVRLKDALEYSKEKLNEIKVSFGPELLDQFE